MRSYIALPIVLAVASVAPAIAAPVTTVPSGSDGSEAINWKKVGDVAGDVASGVGTVLKFLKREDPILAREFEAALLARATAPADSEAINWHKVGDVAGDVASGVGTVLKFLRRDLDDELLARADADASEAINWHKVGDVAGDVASGVGTVLKFLKREDPVLARAFEDELFARATATAPTDSEAINWKEVGGDVLSGLGTVVKFLKREDLMLARELEDELLARTTPPADSEAINWKEVGGDVLSGLGTVAKFLKREDPILARAFEDELLARATASADSEAINWHKVGDVAGDVASGVGTVLKFLKREDPLLARAFEDELMARAEAAAAAAGSQAINWKEIGGDVLSGLGTVAKFLKRDGMMIDELD